MSHTQRTCSNCSEEKYARRSKLSGKLQNKKGNSNGSVGNHSCIVSTTSSCSKQSTSSGIYSMLPSTRERIENQHTFFKNYKYLCEINNSVPKVKIGVENVLHFFGDRIRMEDWPPIIKAIDNDRSLKEIKICNRNLYQAGFTKDPPLYNRKVLNSLSVALQHCLSCSKSLTLIRLEAIPFSSTNIKLLVKGLKENSTIRRIELPHCTLGDNGCEVICRVLRYQTNITAIDLSGCGITTNGANYIAQVIQVQKLIKYGDCWKQSLRYQSPKVNTVNGLSAITLDNNLDLGDYGFKVIVNSLYDDLWITDLCCKNCDLTDESAREAISLIKSNCFIKSIDIRNNHLIDSELILEIGKQLIQNGHSSIPVEKTWNSNENLCQSCNSYGKIGIHSSSKNTKYSSTCDQPSSNRGKVIVSSRLPLLDYTDVRIPPLKLSGLQRNSKKRKCVPVKEVEPSKCEQTMKDICDMKSKLYEEISKRMAAEQYCEQLEAQLKEKDNCVSVEKPLLEKLMKTFFEFSCFLNEIKRIEFHDNVKEVNKINHYNTSNTEKINHLKLDCNNLKEVMGVHRDNSRKLCHYQDTNVSQANSGNVSDPTIRAQELLKRLLCR